ncbi:MAG: DUF1652 domain-containing protein [Pseudomonas sp.]
MAKMTLAYACARLKKYFDPVGFAAELESETALTARLFDVKTGEDLAVVAGLPWSDASTEAELVDIIEALEEELELQEFVHTPLAANDD